MHLAQLRRERQRVDLFDLDGQWRSASRSTITCVSGTSKRSRAFSTTPRSSQCERPTGWVETISSSGPERPHGVLDRLNRVAVADLALDVEPDRPHARQAVIEPVLGVVPRAVLVGDPVLER